MATVDGTVVEEELQRVLNEGVETAEGIHVADLLEVSHVDSEQVPEVIKKHAIETSQ